LRVFVWCVQTSRLDVGNFDKEFTSKEPKLSVIDPSIINKISQDEFRDFSFVNSDYRRHDLAGPTTVEVGGGETTTPTVGDHPVAVASPAAVASLEAATTVS